MPVSAAPIVDTASARPATSHGARKWFSVRVERCLHLDTVKTPDFALRPRDESKGPKHPSSTRKARFFVTIRIIDLHSVLPMYTTSVLSRHCDICVLFSLVPHAPGVSRTYARLGSAAAMACSITSDSYRIRIMCTYMYALFCAPWGCDGRVNVADEKARRKWVFGANLRP